MDTQRTQVADGDRSSPPTVRDGWPAVLAARRLSMSDRLGLALAWNELAAELRVGLSRARRAA